MHGLPSGPYRFAVGGGSSPHWGAVIPSALTRCSGVVPCIQKGAPLCLMGFPPICAAQGHGGERLVSGPRPYFPCPLPVTFIRQASAP